MFNNVIAKTEAFFKGLLFDCKSCGQCLLSRTGLICPMSCPKGLRNGPCGGTIEGKCEVYPDKACVWVRIHKKTGKDLEPLALNASPDMNLYFTSSYVNLLTGRDQATRKPLPYLDLGVNRKSQPLQTDSKLEKAFKAKEFVFTCEVRSPKDGDYSKINKEVEMLKDYFVAINATAFLSGLPGFSSTKTSEKLVSFGVEPISQATCRDHTKTSFVSLLLELRESNIHNLLCLTGDSYLGTPKIKQVWDMDSSLMLYEASYLRKNSEVHFCNQKVKRAPRIFLGAAINPFSTPIEMPIRRLKQKLLAGADFIQTQLIFDLDAFDDFMGYYHAEGLQKELFFLAGIPVVTSKKAFEHMVLVPGIKISEKLKEEFRQASDITAFGVQWAIKAIERIKAYEGIDGVHLMLVGSDFGVLPEIRKHFGKLGAVK